MHFNDGGKALIDEGGLLANHGFAIATIAALVERLGGDVTLRQDDFDGVSFTRLDEGFASGSLRLRVFEL